MSNSRKFRMFRSAHELLVTALFSLLQLSKLSTSNPFPSSSSPTRHLYSSSATLRTRRLSLFLHWIDVGKTKKKKKKTEKERKRNGQNIGRKKSDKAYSSLGLPQQKALTSSPLAGDPQQRLSLRTPALSHTLAR
ncbi:hypothetical protein CDL15_Pgr022330 [Punica granatum]|uniref:Uncharacterized protein n=1 Tax=Punica granatum TaxID=22663 RepID=A0A218Y432_PUNGR|nr:hypothetical protein CDL15_Pgr022330 [Punica granatum]